jgi:hypothetical protein
VPRVSLITAMNARTIENRKRTSPLAGLSRAARPYQMFLTGPAIAGVVSLFAAGCTLTSDEAPSSAAVEARASFTRERLIGRWGIASFHVDKDRPRTEREARSQCGQPYTIARGPTDGVMMHVADDSKLHELRLKGDGAGRTYVGFEAPPGHPQDREILSSTNDLMTMRFVDPDANRRYGTFVYVRCRA